MANIVKFNSEEQPALEINEAPAEEIERQQENKKEINKIQRKAHVQDTESQALEEKQEKAPGNTLDGSGHVHVKSPQDDGVQHHQEGILPDQSNPHAKVWSNDPNDPFANQWGPSMSNEPVTYDTKEESVANETDPSKKSHPPHHHRLGSQSSSDVNHNAFESTMTDLKNIFNTSDQSFFPREKDHHKLENSSPLNPIQPDELIWNLQVKAIKYILVACLVCYLAGRLKFGYIMGLIIIGLCAWTYWNLGRTSSAGLEWQLEKQENMKTLYTSEGESVEWLNYVLEKIWRSVDPDMFTLVEDLLEDTLQSVSPGFIQNIKVSDFDIGVQAPRIQMIRVFPPLPGQPEESIFGEAAFSFHAHPVASLVTNRSPKATPPGLAIRFQTALKAPLEVKAELTAVSGKIRFKILTCPDVPFISKATIAFTSVPKIETGVMPLSKHLNIMNLPTIKALVNEGVKLGFADLVDPKSMTIDIKALMGTFAQDTNAIGVVKVEIREAVRDSSMQLQDMEDSYATLSLSTQPKKSLSSTRVLTNDEDPSWNENLYVLVYKDDIISETKVDVKVWDADKVKYDDMWGSVSMSVKDIVQGKLDKLGNVSSYCMDERVVFDGWTPIDGKDQSKSKVKLNMKMSFHPEYPTPNMEIFSGDAMAKKKKSEQDQQKDQAEKSAIMDIPVDAAHTNGILSIQIHQAVDLEVGDPEVLPTGDEFKHPYSPNKVVSPYAILYVNDNKVFQTRTKLRNPSPHWNAITEHFVRDYETTFIRVSVKTSVDLERDPVLGTKSLLLKDLFIDQDDKFKQVQKWIPLANGIGFGKILLSVKYKPVKMTLPRELQGSDVGTLIIERLGLTNLKQPYDDNYITSTSATLALNVDPAIIKRLKAKSICKPHSDDGQEHDATETLDSVGPYGWYSQHLYFPIMMRYRTALYIHIHQGSISTTKSTGRFWLKNMVDDQWQDIVVGLHPYLSEKTKEANRNENDWSEDGEFGQVTIRMKLVPGFSPVHTHLQSFAKDFIGADPFYSDTLKYKAQKWIQDQNKKGKDDTEQAPFDYEMQAAVQAEKHRQHESEEFNQNGRRISSASSEYGQDSDDISDMDDTEFQADMMDQRKKKNISKHRVVRKVAWSLDKMKHKVDVLREGFNSETRASRSVAKEV